MKRPDIIPDAKAVKISIVTASYNRETTIGQAVSSVTSQSYAYIEHVIIDGASSDRTVENARAAARTGSIILSEPDSGLYDALNKGITLATGDVIGFVHSDDFLPDPEILARVAEVFEDPNVDAVYGDLDYISASDSGHIVRHWKSSEFTHRKLAFGWLPPHPTLFLRRHIYEREGLFDTDFRISADYDFILRTFRSPDIQVVYVPKVFVKMRVGGESNRSLKHIIRKSREDILAIRRNGVGGIGTLIAKNLTKIPQFFIR